MKGVSGKAKNGSIYRYYTCKCKNEEHKCTRKNVNKEIIENAVINKCKEILNDDNISIIAKQVYEKCQQENNSTLLIKEYEQQIKTIEKSIDNLLVAIERGENIDLINDKITKNRELLEAKKLLLAKEKNKIMTLDEDQIKFFLTQLKTGDINDADYRKRLVNIFVNEIYLAETEVTVIFNVSKQKISLSVPITDKDKTFINANALSYTTQGSYKTVMVSQEGFEPPTPGLEGLCSIQLSY